MTTQEKREILLRIMNYDWLPNQITPILVDLDFDIDEYGESAEFVIKDTHVITPFFDIYKAGGTKQELFQQNHSGMDSIEELRDESTEDLFAWAQEMTEVINTLLEKGTGRKTISDVWKELGSQFETYRKKLNEELNKVHREAKAELQQEQGGGEVKR